MSAKSETTLVVMETGSEWPAWIDGCRPGGGPDSHATRVITQDERESPRELAERVIDAADGVRQLGRAIDTTVIACSERTDAAALSARRAAASALLSAMARSGRGRLLFSVNRRASGRARHAICALASDLADAWDGSGLLVSVRFGADALEPIEADAEARVA